jgi:hypothetical protein
VPSSGCGDRLDSAKYGELDENFLMPTEVEIMRRYASVDGKTVGDRDIDFLLRRISYLRRVIGEIVANSGEPKKDSNGNEWASVPTNDLELASTEAAFTGEQYKRSGDQDDE